MGLGLDGTQRGSYQVVNQPNKSEVSSSQNSVVSYRGRKITKTSPLKRFVKAFVNLLKKNDKPLNQRSISLPDLRTQKSYIPQNIQRSASTPVINTPSEPVLKSVKPLPDSAASETRKEAVSVEVPEPAATPRTPETTARLQLDVLDGTSRAGSTAPLNIKQLTGVFQNALTKTLVSSHINDFAKTLSQSGHGHRFDVHQTMKNSADQAIDSLLQNYPDLAQRFSSEDKQAISRELQASALVKMSQEVWSTPGADEYAENSESDFVLLSQWAKEPKRVVKPKPEGVSLTPQKPQVKSDSLSQPQSPQASGSPPAETPESESAPTALSAEKPADQSELISGLSSGDATVSSMIQDNVGQTGLNVELTEKVALLFRDAIVQQGLTRNQALTVAIETANWLNDEADFEPDLVFEASESLIQWIKAGQPEKEAVSRLTDWLDSENWDNDDDYFDDDDLATETIQTSSSIVTAPENTDEADTPAPPPPAPPPPPLPGENKSVNQSGPPPAPPPPPVRESVSQPLAQQEKTASSKPSQDDALQKHLAAIREGVQLRKTGGPNSGKVASQKGEVQESAYEAHKSVARPEKSDLREELFKSIREGKTLNKVSDEDKNQYAKFAPKGAIDEGMGAALNRAVKETYVSPTEKLTQKLADQFEEFSFEQPDLNGPDAEAFRSELRATIEKSTIADGLGTISDTQLKDFADKLLDMDVGTADLRGEIETWIEQRIALAARIQSRG